VADKHAFYLFYLASIMFKKTEASIKKLSANFMSLKTRHKVVANAI